MLRLPNSSQRLFVVGKTGSGKTQAAVWHLSKTDFDKRPWIVLDFKGDSLIGAIDGAEELEVTSKAPKKPGIYVLRPLPGEEEELDEFLWKVWERGKTGVYVDEGYMIGNSKPFRALLTQGRSKHIPMLILSQRPVFLTRFAISEADFFQVFWLNDDRDRLTLKAFVPADMNERLPDYHSVWYDVGDDVLAHLGPVPNKREILQGISDRLRAMNARKSFFFHSGFPASDLPAKRETILL